MKLQLAIASGKTLDVEIRPDDTFTTLISRTHEESGIKLQLFHFGISGKKIKYNDNVVNYFVGPPPPEEELYSYFAIQLCRLCAQPSDNMAFIFQDSNLEESINTWLPTEVSETDMLPKQVCDRCIEKLEFCKTFQIECVQAEVVLKDLLSSEKVSISRPSDKPEETAEEEATGPKVFECGFVFGQRGSSTAVKTEKKPIEDYCCPLCYEGSMAQAAQEIADELNSKPWLSESDIVLEEIKMEPFDECDIIEESPIKNNRRSLRVLPIIKTELEGNPSDEDDVAGDADILESNLDTDEMAHPSSGCAVERLPKKRLPPSTAQSNDENVEDAQPMVIKRKKRVLSNSSEIVSEELRVSCAICEESLSSMDDLLEHAFERHSGTEFFPCPFCPLAFDIAPQLMAHFAVKHNRDSRGDGDQDLLLHHCNKCSVYFPSDVELSKHNCAQERSKRETSKNLKRTVACTTCGKLLKSKMHLEFHMQFHMKGTKPLYCHICHEDFETEESMYTHFRWFHKDQEPKCSICNKSFANYNTLIIHKKLHSNIRKYQCGTCLKSFIDKQTLAEHIVTHMDTTPFQCHICQKYLARNSRLKQHLLIHEVQDKGPQEVYDCSVCRQVFPTEAAAVRHGKKCHEDTDNSNATFEIEVVDKVFRCEFCNRNYVTPEVLNEHRQTHVGVKRFDCEFCTATFESFARLTSHKIKHGGSNAKTSAEDTFQVPLHYLCNECDQTYFLWSYLTIHKKQKHAEVQCLHRCKICSESFENSWSLAYHRKSKHGHVSPKNTWWGKAARIHECHFCNKLFASQLLLAKHQVYHHGSAKGKVVDTVTSCQCDTCGKTFVKQAYLEKHMKVHEGGRKEVCRHCGKTFVHESSLKKHMKSHSNRHPYQCNFCSKRFLMKHDLEVHTWRHTGFKPYQCEACDKCFRTKSMLVQHTRIHTNERPYPCDMCELAFRRSWALKNHKRIHTGQKPFECSICKKAFRLKQDVQSHMTRVHSIVVEHTENVDLTQA